MLYPCTSLFHKQKQHVLVKIAVFSFLLLVVCQCAVAQAPAAGQGAYNFPCSASAKNMPGTFSGFWTPKPHGIGEVEVRFEQLDSEKRRCASPPLPLLLPG